MSYPRRIASLLAVLPLLALASTSHAQGDVHTGAFRIRFDAAAFDAPFTGDVFVAFAQATSSTEPRQAMHGWFDAPPVMRFAVEGIEPGGEFVATSDAAVASAPVDWSTVEGKSWRVQAIARRSSTGRRAGLDAGDVVSRVERAIPDPTSSWAVDLSLSTVIEEQPFEESERIREFVIKSEALSEFHGFDYELRAGVLLPKDYGERDSYPVVYSVTGFGGTHHSIFRWNGMITPGSPLEECIVVVPDATNRYGHSVFCDSRSIGPWGEALVRELIPALEQEYGGAGPEHRYVTGVSSGGWSSLWLQVAYPEEFAGCFSHVPDPIDFKDFQGIDLYTPLEDGSPRNMYVDEEGNPRPLARNGDEVLVTVEDFVRRENVLNPGGQMRSFEATFSPLGEDGTPRRVFDVETGEIDHAAAVAWRPYDISHTLLTNWDALKPRLAGKIHVYAGEVDTFYLEGAVERFQSLAREQGLLDDMVVEVIPGMAHALYPGGQEALEKTIAERWAQRTDAAE